MPTYEIGTGRLQTVAFDAATYTLAYHATKGTLTSVATSDGSTLTYAYDGALPTSSTWSGNIAGSVSRTYDSSFRIASEQVNSANTINYGYDNDDLLTSAGALTISRSPTTGFVTGTTLGSVADSYTYDSYGAPETYTAAANGSTVYSVDYGTRDPLGRISTKTETIQGETHAYGYTYDAVGRLTDVTKDGSALSHYDYDANGNRTVAPGLTTTPVYDAQDRMTSYGDCTYGYKADGSLQSKTCPDGTTSYSYDSFGNLRHVSLPGGTNIDYVIDGQNRRVGKKVNGTLVEGFLYRSQLQPAAWLNPDGTIKATFIYGLQPSVPEYMVKAGVSYRLITNEVGSVRLVVDSAGTVAERIDYDEFGNVLSDSAPGFQPFGFAGGLRDVDTGLVRFGARDYDAANGRWVAKDPLRFGGGTTSLYSYVGADPLNRIDPTGLWAFGFTVEISTINPFTSGHGGAYGINLEYTSDYGWAWYKYSTPDDSESEGFFLGPSFTANFALGNGAWTGPFNNAGGSFGPITGGVFQSPPDGDDPGYFGWDIGFGKGPPGLGISRTNYSFLRARADCSRGKK